MGVATLPHPSEHPSTVPVENSEPCPIEHAPLISAPESVRSNEVFPLAIEVGPEEQPDDPDHFIEWIELYFGNTFLFRVNLPRSPGQRRITLPVKLPHGRGPLKVWHKCSRHGIREGARDIVVTG